jgi:VIT1/CCC1 family predicted Fe2+/Mn2+ transporter
MALEDVYARNLEHRTHRAGWLRAAVLGANDGLVSTAALLIGVAAARADSFLVTAGLAGISAGAMSMAVGEYVSVRSQNDIEDSDRLLEMQHLSIDPEGELQELKHIYIDLGLTPEQAEQDVATAVSSARAAAAADHERALRDVHAAHEVAISRLRADIEAARVRGAADAAAAATAAASLAAAASFAAFAISASLAARRATPSAARAASRASTSSITAIGALSPLRGPILTMRV